MNIVFNCDENYAPYLSVTLASLIKHHPEKSLNLYVLEMGISKISKEFVRKRFQSEKVKLHFITVNEEDFNALPQTVAYISKVTYARLLMGQYLPQGLDRVLYLDVDIIVNDNLTALYEMDLAGKSLGAGIDLFVEAMGDYKANIGLAGCAYFNSGVLLIDLNRYRQKEMLKEASEYLKAYPQINFQDQDILNAIFANDVTYFDLRYNFQSFVRSCLKKAIKFCKKTGQPLPFPCTMPVAIFHDTGKTKAWHKKCKNVSAIYFQQHLKTLQPLPEHWKAKLENPSLWQMIVRQAKAMTLYRRYNIH